MMLQVLEEVLRCRQSEGWLVGGTVRDRSLGRPSPDLDVVVADDPAKCAEEVSARLDSPWFPLSTRHGAYRVVGPEGHIDLAGLRGRTILDDLALRDFTINAMAIPLDGVGEELVDPFGGLSDLAAGLLVATSDHIFDDDPLRLMRAVRFSHLLGLRIAPPLEALVRSRAGELSRSSHERIVSELAMTLAPRDSVAAVSMLTELGLLETVLPETGEEDSSSALVTLDAMLAGSWSGGSWTGPLLERLSVAVDGTFSRPAALRLAMLLRHVPPGSIALTGKRLKLSGSLVALLQAVSAWYERGGEDPSASRGLEIAAGSPRGSTLFLWETAPWEPEVILVAAADSVAHAASRAAVDAVFDRASPGGTLLERWEKRSLGTTTPPFDGNLLMTTLGLEQGPLLGQVLRETRLAWESGEISALNEVLDVARATLAALRAH